MLSNVTLDEKVLPTTHGQLKPPLGKHRLKVSLQIYCFYQFCIFRSCESSFRYLLTYRRVINFCTLASIEVDRMANTRGSENGWSGHRIYSLSSQLILCIRWFWRMCVKIDFGQSLTHFLYSYVFYLTLFTLSGSTLTPLSNTQKRKKQKPPSFDVSISTASWFFTSHWWWYYLLADCGELISVLLKTGNEIAERN